MGDETAFDLVLAGVELCTEAIERAPGTELSLSASLAGGDVTIEVSWSERPQRPGDEGPEVRELHGAATAPEWRRRILARVCDELSNHSGQDGAVVVRARRRLSARP